MLKKLLGVGGLASLLALGAYGSSHAAVLPTVTFDSDGDGDVIGGLSIGDGVAVDATIIDSGSYSNILTFSLNQTSDVSISATWFAKTIFANSLDLKLIGPGGVVGDDAPVFTGATQTVSSLVEIAGLAAGTYTILTSGNIFGDAAKYSYAVEVTPIPGSIALLGTAMAGATLLGLRRRKRAQA